MNKKYIRILGIAAVLAVIALRAADNFNIKIQICHHMLNNGKLLQRWPE